MPWDPDLEEASDTPPYILLIDNWFPICRKRRRKLVSYTLGDSCAGASRIDKSDVAQQTRLRC